ncbi:TPA: phage tail protein, partial [Streptococcus agalactiae]|nr:phage tail protein [Streptococcus agalactiae]
LKLSDGMDIPIELADKFKFARQKSKLAGIIRGSYFTLKGENETLMQRWLDNMK